MRHKDLRNRRPPPYNLLHFNREKAPVSFQKRGTNCSIRPAFLFRFRTAIPHGGEGEATSCARTRDTRASTGFRFFSSPFTCPTFSPDRQVFWGEHQPTFLSSPREWTSIRKTFTPIKLWHNKLRHTGEEVKAKNENLLTRARTRAREKGYFFALRRGVGRGSTSAKILTTRRASARCSTSRM